MTWIMENWEAIIAIITGLVTVASIVAKLTPTETDNLIVGKILQIIDKLALNNKPTEVRKFLK